MIMRRVGPPDDERPNNRLLSYVRPAAVRTPESRDVGRKEIQMADIDFNCEHCGKKLTTDEKGRGMLVPCPDCGNEITIPKYDTSHSALQEPPHKHSPPPPPPPLQAIKKRPISKEYKVLTQKDKWFSGKFDPERLEQAINAYAAQGWQVVSMATANIPGLGGNREEMVIILSREK